MQMLEALWLTTKYVVKAKNKATCHTIGQNTGIIYHLTIFKIFVGLLFVRIIFWGWKVYCLFQSPPNKTPNSLY
jgi:hypothetical protein